MRRIPLRVRMPLGLAAAAIGLVAPASAAATDRTVNDDTSGIGPAGANCAAPDFSTIQAAVSAASAGDRVLVCAGTYNETVTIDKTLALLGAQAGVDARDRAVPTTDESVITGQPSATADGGIAIVANDVAVDGFTIQDVDASPLGTGIATNGSHSDQNIRNNIIRSNIFGMSLNNAAAAETVVRHNWFDENNDPGAASGDGIFSDRTSNAEIRANLFTGQTSAAIVLNAGSPGSDLEISGNEMRNDSTTVVLESTDVLIQGNEITNPNGSAIFLDQDDGVDVLANTIDDSGQDNQGNPGGDSSLVRLSTAFFSGPNTDVNVSGNDLANGGKGISIGDGALSGLLEAHFNRFAGNAVAGIENDDLTDAVAGANNWWGCNEGPSSAVCDQAIGAVDADPWLTLTADARRHFVRPGRRVRITASLDRNSDGETLAGCAFPDGVPVGFSATGGTLRPQVSTTAGCRASTRLRVHRSDAGDAITVTATLDEGSATTDVQVGRRAKRKR